MSFFCGKSDDFVLNRRTVSRAYSLDLSPIQRRPIQRFSDDLMGMAVGVSQIAQAVVIELPLKVKGKGTGRLISPLHLQGGKVDRTSIHPGRGTGFEPAGAQAKFFHRLGEVGSSGQTIRAGEDILFSDKNTAVEESAGTHHQRPCLINGASHAQDAGDFSFLGEDLRRLSLANGQVLTVLQHFLHILLVSGPIGLGSGRMDSRTFSPVEHAELNAADIGRTAHLSAQGVDLPHQLALGGATDGRVAGHIAHAVQIGGDHQGTMAQPGRGQRRLDASMASSDNHHFICSCQIRHDCSPIFLHRTGRKCRGRYPRSPHLPTLHPKAAQPLPHRPEKHRR